jgi:Na+/phosphate symporter
MYLLQNAFIYNSSKSLDECEVKAKEIHENEKIFTEEVIAEVKADPDLRVYVSVPGHMERMGDYIEDIIGCIRTKIKEGILFTDKAVSEVTFLMERLQEVLKNTGDIILARNRIIRDYVKESSTEISRSANEFSTMHEERLIEGLCMPKASSLFLHILDALKGIAWHAKEIAEKLTA